jgi:IclR family transcriptional regulator, acetate operon repressor
VLEGTSVRYLDAVESSRALRVASRTGSAPAANCTASGKALLAALPDEEVAALFAGQQALTALTARSITSRSRLLAELHAVRERGCAVNREESEEASSLSRSQCAARSRSQSPRWSCRRRS